jgi:hypothetical protein
VGDWTARDRAEFEAQVGPLAEQLGYSYDTTALAAAEPPLPPPASEPPSARPSVGQRARQVLGCLKRALT